uniref:Zinc finger CCCH domain-containing protein 55 isoform X2 n=1 Tax=Rhizophora mucronata TaxID=61149 RepID=A0A2P2IQS6_RHIMU
MPLFTNPETSLAGRDWLFPQEPPTASLGEDWENGLLLLLGLDMGFSGE